MASSFARQLVARAWTTEATQHKEMDVELAEAFADILEGQCFVVLQDRIQNDLEFGIWLLCWLLKDQPNDSEEQVDRVMEAMRIFGGHKVVDYYLQENPRPQAKEGLRRQILP